MHKKTHATYLPDLHLSLRPKVFAEVRIFTVFVWVLYEVSLGGCEVFYCHTLVSQFLHDTHQVAWIRIPMTVTHTRKHMTELYIIKCPFELDIER